MKNSQRKNSLTMMRSNLKSDILKETCKQKLWVYLSEYEPFLPPAIEFLRHLKNFYFPRKTSEAAPRLTEVFCNSNFFEFTLSHGCFPVNLWLSCRAPIQKNTSGGLLLNLICFSCKYKKFHGLLLLFINFSITKINLMENKSQQNKMQ